MAALCLVLEEIRPKSSGRAFSPPQALADTQLAPLAPSRNRKWLELDTTPRGWIVT
jgi:hypothetical protein